MPSPGHPSAAPLTANLSSSRCDGTAEKPKDHLHVLLAVGMYEGQWRPFETEISGLKLELADRLSREGKGRFELAD